MSHLQSFLKYWLPVFAWMCLIFSASTGAMATRQTSRFIGPFLRWLKPDISAAALARVQFTVRKGGHVTEFAVLAVLLWRAWRKPFRGDARPWRWSEAAAAFLLAALYAGSDELHQAFVPAREARVGDVMWDATGAALGLLALRVAGRWRNWPATARSI